MIRLVSAAVNWPGDDKLFPGVSNSCEDFCADEDTLMADPVRYAHTTEEIAFTFLVEHLWEGEISFGLAVMWIRTIIGSAVPTG